MSLNWLNVELRGFSVRITAKTVFLFFLIIFMGSGIYSKCLSRDESYKRFVEQTSLAQSYEENEKSIRSLKKHLKCYPEKEVFYKLAVIYEYSQKHYLAEIAYQKAGKDDDQKRMANIIINKKGAEKEKFIAVAESKAAKHLELYKNKKTAATVFHIAGPIVFATGLSLFIHDKAGGENSLTAQYVLMFGGMSLISSGIFLNAFAKNSLRTSQAYGGFSQSFRGDGGTTPDEFFVNSGIDAKTRKALSVSYRKNGVGLMLMSIPMFAIAIYGFFDSYNYHNEKTDEDCSHGLCDIEMLGHILQMFSLAPAILSLTGGIILLAKASKYEKLSTEPSLLTLNSIAPVIDPISKTYGLSMGFSF
jgi:hypothetical protein